MKLWLVDNELGNCDWLAVDEVIENIDFTVLFRSSDSCGNNLRSFSYVLVSTQ